MEHFEIAVIIFLAFSLGIAIASWRKDARRCGEGYDEFGRWDGRTISREAYIKQMLQEGYRPVLGQPGVYSKPNWTP